MSSHRYLLCSLDSYGFMYPTIGLALALQSRGHDVAIATSPVFAETLAQLGLRRIPNGDADDRMSFETKLLTHPHETGRQVKHLRYALDTYDPHILITQQMALGALLVGEWFRLPVAVMGQASYFFPKFISNVNEAPTNDEEARAKTMHLSFLTAYNQARELMGYASKPFLHYHQSPLLGDVFMVRSIPELEQEGANLPGRLTYVGDMLWEPERAAPADLTAWLDASIASGEPIVYVEPGRIHYNQSFYPSLMEALADQPVRVAVSCGRMNREYGTPPPNFFVAPHVPMGAVLPHASLAISASTSTAILGGLTQGVPFLLIVTQDGEQPSNADMVCRMGVAETLSLFDCTPVTLRAQVMHQLQQPERQARAREVARLFESYRGPDTAVHVLEGLATRLASVA